MSTAVFIFIGVTALLGLTLFVWVVWMGGRLVFK